ncbi:DUF192 domain-containing protein [Natronobacterium gregoryi SP2]|uniref:DUF192 domain-containing protein n=2 Tax=Natronobacterium gregoryi TaxID=44930 RepID=L9XXY5_NATGS|nr:hypothetical protein C490_12797 [Natronobacterium gregoryi SP2]PLK21362.1 DUF192 domain-containing protein [Natronobacterium gregoryi SP2]
MLGRTRRSTWSSARTDPCADERFFTFQYRLEVVRLRHKPAGGASSVLATSVELADSIVSQARGLMFRRSFSDDSALVFRFDGASTRDVHMLFVFFPIDAVWVVDGEVQRVERLRPWLGLARAEADMLVELPAGTANDIEPGDRLFIEES